MTELRCTYRLQLGPGLGFTEARELVPYLRDLGVSHLYLPPSFQARAGSTHGYDVVDPTSISSELGGEEAFRALVGAAREAGLGVILDIVPNHMAVDDANRYWADPALREKFFDIDPETGRHRRFFDIDHLAGVRQEDPEVFEETHRLALALVREGVVDGLRIDHPDGMADPAGYLRRLAEAGVERVWVEKILDPGEHLRDWPVEGTVGYEFLNDVQALFVDPVGEAALSSLDSRAFGDLAFDAKLEQASTTFQPEVERLNRVARVQGVERLLASLPVYRTYDGGQSAEDRAVLEEAGLADLYAGRPAEWVTRFQQTTPPVMAKGVEDTAFYRYVRLLALNDVGGDPSRFGITVEQFHEANLVRQERFPRNLLITQTHDTKRSGDVRARIGALAGMADEYVALAREWLRPGPPDELEQLFVFQTMLGAWPISEERVRAYFEKALREAKRNSNWIEPDEDYERRVADFALEVPSFAGFEAFAAKVAEAGHRSAMAQTLLKLTAPGVPDIYQGDELVTLNLVDPDNRRQVDWAKRRAMLDGEAGDPRDREKLDLIRDALRLRAERPEAFAGSYEPLPAGPDVCAYLRGGSVLVVAVVREAGQDAAIEGHSSVRDVTDGRSYALVAR
ncbi:MAG TPA: malto-oligosyltrehalose synthase [Actinomycetota bacterium]|nr:malto-oligosyltrehalose synthase [Actinomycetota bacterium]